MKKVLLYIYISITFGNRWEMKKGEKNLFWKLRKSVKKISAVELSQFISSKAVNRYRPTFSIDNSVIWKLCHIKIIIFPWYLSYLRLISHSLKIFSSVPTVYEYNLNIHLILVFQQEVRTPPLQSDALYWFRKIRSGRVLTQLNTLF